MMTAIFDLDGTLFDTREVNYHAYYEAMREFGCKLDHEYFCKECNGRHYIDFLSKLMPGKEETWGKIHEAKKLLYGKYLDRARKNDRLFSLIDALKETGWRIALVTTASRKNTYQLLDFFKTQEVFDLILTGEDVEKKKPDPEGFLKAMDFFQADVGETVIFEDSQDGRAAAKASGALTLLVEGYH